MRIEGGFGVQRFALALALGAGLALGPMSLSACAQNGGASAAKLNPERARQPLEIVTAAGPKALMVELSDDEGERARGLMYREAMAPDHGMLFDFKAPQPVSMWMKDTRLALDMLFIDSEGQIVGIISNARPGSLRQLTVGSPVLAVLELNAGRAAQLGVKQGDVVKHPIFKPAKK